MNPMHMNILMSAIAGGVYVTPYYIDSIKTPFGLPTYVGYGTFGRAATKTRDRRRAGGYALHGGN